jgi:hypothetical protein
MEYLPIADERADVSARYAADVRPCGNCREQLKREAGCNYVICPKCQTGQCWLCGKAIPHTSEALQNHGCNPQASLEQEIRIMGAKQRAVTNPKSVIVQMPVGPLQTIEYVPNKTVLEAKREIQKKANVPIGDLATLTHTGTILDDSKTLAESRIRPKSLLVVTTAVRGG